MFKWTVTGHLDTTIVIADTKDEAKRKGTAMGAGVGCKAEKIGSIYDIDWPVFSIDNLKTSTDYNDETPTYYNYDDYGTTFIMDGDDIVGDR